MMGFVVRLLAFEDLARPAVSLATPVADLDQLTVGLVRRVGGQTNLAEGQDLPEVLQNDLAWGSWAGIDFAVPGTVCAGVVAG